MIQQALIEVVKNQLNAGVSEAEVREFLRRRGTDEAEIREIFDTVALAMPDPNRVMPVEIPAPVAVPEPIPAPSAPAPEEAPVISVKEPVAPDEPAPTKTEAHGVVREVPPLQPTVPFAVANGASSASVTQSIRSLLFPIAVANGMCLRSLRQRRGLRHFLSEDGSLILFILARLNRNLIA